MGRIFSQEALDAIGKARAAETTIEPVQWVNDERTVLVTRWDDGSMHVALRAEPDHVWGPPTLVRLEEF